MPQDWNMPMSPSVINAIEMDRLNKGVAAVLRMNSRLQCYAGSQPEIVPMPSADRVKVRFWLTSTYSIMVLFSWDASVGEYQPAGIATPDLVDVSNLFLNSPGMKLMPS